MKHRTRLTALLSVSPLLLLSAVLLFTGCPREPAADGFYDLLVIDTFAPVGYNDSDTFLTLIDHKGTFLASDDDGNPDTINHRGYSRIRYDVGLEGGTYYIKVHKPTEEGAVFYCIRAVTYDPGDVFPTLDPVNETVDDDDDEDLVTGVPLNPVPLGLGDSAAQSRAIYPELTDVDWFVLVLP